MTNTSGGTLGDAGGWDVYWQGMWKNPQHQRGGTQEAVLEGIWLELFGQFLRGEESRRCLELACGSGAVSLHAAAVDPTAKLTCSDVSTSALQLARERLPGALLVASDASRLPFPVKSFDFVFSQFGIEYAGPRAMLEAAAMVAPGGQLALVVHMRDGAIYEDYKKNLAAIRLLRDSNFLALVGAAFTTGLDLNEGTGSLAQFKSAEQDLQPAIRAVESIFRQFGEAVADGMPRQLYRDVAHMYPRMRAYERREIMLWLDGFVRELDAYCGRLGSMLASALDDAAIESMQRDFGVLGLRKVRKEIIQLGNPARPSGWLLLLEQQTV